MKNNSIKPYPTFIFCENYKEKQRENNQEYCNGSSANANNTTWLAGFLSSSTFSIDV